MSTGSDRICVWLENGKVHVGVRRVYDFDENAGYIIKDFGYFWELEYKDAANSLAVEISGGAKLPLEQHWKE